MTKKEAWDTMSERISEVVQQVEGTDPQANTRFGEKIGKPYKYDKAGKVTEKPGKIIAEWRNPRRSPRPSRDDLLKISEVYGISFEYLLYGVGAPLTEHEEHQEEHHAPQPEAIRTPREPATLEKLLERSQDTLDRYLALVERQESVIEHLSITLANMSKAQPAEDPPAPSIHRVGLKRRMIHPGITKKSRG